VKAVEERATPDPAPCPPGTRRRGARANCLDIGVDNGGLESEAGPGRHRRVAKGGADVMEAITQSGPGPLLVGLGPEERGRRSRVQPMSPDTASTARTASARRLGREGAGLPFRPSRAKPPRTRTRNMPRYYRLSSGATISRRACDASCCILSAEPFPADGRMRRLSGVFMLLVSACSTGRSGGVDPMAEDPNAPVRIYVTNNHGYPVEIYAAGQGTSYRVGTVLPGQATKFRLRPGMIGHGRSS
jgi:hypothetical protein